jgi:hypothetical protein
LSKDDQEFNKLRDTTRWRGTGDLQNIRGVESILTLELHMIIQQSLTCHPGGVHTPFTLEHLYEALLVRCPRSAFLVGDSGVVNIVIEYLEQ